MKDEITKKNDTETFNLSQLTILCISNDTGSGSDCQRDVDVEIWVFRMSKSWKSLEFYLAEKLWKWRGFDYMMAGELLLQDTVAAPWRWGFWLHTIFILGTEIIKYNEAKSRKYEKGNNTGKGIKSS